MHWAAEMAFRLLEERHACRSSSAASSSSNGGSSNGGSSTSDGGSGCWQQWIDSLPLSVVTPVEFTTEEVEQLVLPSTVQVRQYNQAVQPGGTVRQYRPHFACKAQMCMFGKQQVTSSVGILQYVCYLTAW